VSLSVVISGGGIGGLATAAAFGQRDWDVTVFERQPELRTVGSGIYIWENGLRVLEALGAYDFATQGCFRGTQFEHRNNKNEIIDSLRLPDDSRLMTVMRSQLLESLRQVCVRNGVKIRTSMETVGATTRGELLFANGERVAADLAVGVDGTWSKVREGLGIPFVHRLTREGCLRTIVPRQQDDFLPSDAGKYIENWNGLRRFLITPTSETSIYLALTCSEDDFEARDLPINKNIWLRYFPAWRHLINRIGKEATWGVYSIMECREWSAGRTAILGDAAHAQPPNLGQGGGMAMQNGLALAVFMENVADRRDIPAQLEAWERKVRPLTDHCQKWSTLYGEVAYLPDDVRAKTFKGASHDRWVADQLLLAANSIPLGTATRLTPLEASHELRRGFEQRA
jgi:2-polyprenyl-6-methoxyphenol hydroxylase-like FAD-dependent oxidoreductase